mmetsp:Transcript_37300/g.80307  ORF Transcript_37300/g.80307 Transcript_37300/m.80307 type:complete len:88 (-) Transcript_37300:598-861(-)
MFSLTRAGSDLLTLQALVLFILLVQLLHFGQHFSWGLVWDALRTQKNLHLTTSLFKPLVLLFFGLDGMGSTVDQRCFFSRPMQPELP